MAPVVPNDLEIKYDDEARNWYFVIPSLHIVGGGDRTREDAERHAADAIAFTRQHLAEEAAAGSPSGVTRS
mgnify:CR=1 FL=1